MIIIKKVESIDHFYDLIKNEKEVLFKFYAPWCGKCMQIDSKVDYKNAYALDIDIFPEIASNYNVEKIPFFILFKNGTIYKRQKDSAYKFLKEKL